MRKPALCAALAAAFPACAVTLSTDGTGQALIYPYYTAQSVGSDAFNTYLSVVNHTADAKALRLRFREGRLGKAALDLNVYLSPNDVWTGAVVPFNGGTRLISADVSCTEPRFAVTVAPGEAPFIDFRNDLFSGLNDDGAGSGLDRTREGFVEILEMATLTGASAAAVTHNSAGIPANCAALSAGAPLVAAPSGGLSGTLTLINVASGMDFTVNAEALDALASRPYFRPAGDPYPDFNAAEIDAVSVVNANGATYRSSWARPVDAVSAALMRDETMFEYVLDQPTASLTDVVVTLPTRSFYSTATSASAPFAAAMQWAPDCGADAASAGFGEPLGAFWFDREERSAVSSGADFPEPPPPPPTPRLCGSSSVFSVRNVSLVHMPRSTERTAVLGSVGGFRPNGSSGSVLSITANIGFSNGWIALRSTADRSLVSGNSSIRVNHASGGVATGAHAYRGLPMIGFSARIFRNGTLRCDAGACQGNYGGAFPFKYRRNIAPAS